MKQVSGKDFCKILEKNNWELKRINASHHIYVKLGFNERISIPVHGNKPLKFGLLKALMKSAAFLESDL